MSHCSIRYVSYNEGTYFKQSSALMTCLLVRDTLCPDHYWCCSQCTN